MTVAEAAWVAAVRGVLGAGVGLFFGEPLPSSHRKVLAWTFMLVGVTTAIPTIIEALDANQDAGWRGSSRERREYLPVPAR
jgi:hypothetical protein